MNFVGLLIKIKNEKYHAKKLENEEEFYGFWSLTTVIFVLFFGKFRRQELYMYIN